MARTWARRARELRARDELHARKTRATSRSEKHCGQGDKSNMACVGWCRFAKLKGVSRTVGKLYISTDVAKTDRLIERVKKFVFGEGAPPDRDIKETVERFVKK